MKYVITSASQLTVGQKVTARRGDGSGQGGTVTKTTPDSVYIVSPIGMDFEFSSSLEYEIEIPFDADECLDYHPDECSGEVDMRWPGSGSRSWPRCYYHGEKRVNNVSELERYADSDVAPSWYTPDLDDYSGPWNEEY